MWLVLKYSDKTGIVTFNLIHDTNLPQKIIWGTSGTHSNISLLGSFMMFCHCHIALYDCQTTPKCLWYSQDLYCRSSLAHQLHGSMAIFNILLTKFEYKFSFLFLKPAFSVIVRSVSWLLILIVSPCHQQRWLSLLKIYKMTVKYIERLYQHSWGLAPQLWYVYIYIYRCIGFYVCVCVPLCKIMIYLPSLPKIFDMIR